MYYPLYQKPKQVAAAKFVMWFFSILGISFYGFAFIANWTTWRADVLFVCGLAGFWVAMYYRIRKNEQALRKEDEESEMRRIKILLEKQKLT